VALIETCGRRRDVATASPGACSWPARQRNPPPS